MRQIAHLFTLMLVVLTFTPSVYAHQGFWSKTYTITHPLSEGESIASVKQIMLEKARIKASFDIRHYKLKGKNIDLTNHKHFVPILQAAYLNITAQTAPQIIKKTPFKRQQVYVVQQIRASLDEHSIGTSIITIDNNRPVEKKMLTLDNEFSNSLKNLGEIDQAISADNISAQQSARFIRQQDQEVIMISNTLNEVRQLLTAEFNDPNFNLSQLLKIRQNIDADIIEPILRAKVQTQISQIKELNNGEIEVQVRVGWHLPFHDMRLIHQYMRAADVTVADGRSTYLKMARYYNEENRALSTYSENIFNYLANQNIYLDISLAGQHQQINVLYANGGDLMNKCNDPLHRKASADLKQSVCIVEQAFDDKQIVSQPNQGNPLTFKIKADELNEQLVVKVQQVWQKTNVKEDKKWQRDMSKYN